MFCTSIQWMQGEQVIKMRRWSCSTRVSAIGLRWLMEAQGHTARHYRCTDTLCTTSNTRNSLLLVLCDWHRFALWYKLQGRCVDAVPLAGHRPIIEDMAQVRTRLGVNDLHAGHKRNGVVWHLENMLRVDWRIERRPSCARVKLGLRLEQRQPAWSMCMTTTLSSRSCIPMAETYVPLALLSCEYPLTVFPVNARSVPACSVT